LRSTNLEEGWGTGLSPQREKRKFPEEGQLVILGRLSARYRHGQCPHTQRSVLRTENTMCHHARFDDVWVSVVTVLASEQDSMEKNNVYQHRIVRRTIDTMRTSRTERFRLCKICSPSLFHKAMLNLYTIAPGPFA
jgi:hypothetical protein